MCENCTFVKGGMAICDCDCPTKIAQNKVLIDFEKHRLRCKSCGHQLGMPENEFDEIVAQHNKAGRVQKGLPGSMDIQIEDKSL